MAGPPKRVARRRTEHLRDVVTRNCRLQDIQLSAFAACPQDGRIGENVCAERALRREERTGAGGRMFRRHTLINKAGSIRPSRFPGGYRSRVTPVPIPNTEVKPATADGTAWVTAWESRSLPGLFSTARLGNQTGRFLFQAACR
jgi:hypothetical protein